MLSALRATQQALEASQTSAFGAQVYLYRRNETPLSLLRQSLRGRSLTLKTVVHKLH